MDNLSGKKWCKTWGIVSVKQYFSKHPDWTFIRPKEFRQKYFDGTLETFDAVFSYSSLEHSGLGTSNFFMFHVY